MTVQGSFPVIETGLFKHQDARDPIGVWGAQGNITGDASGGQIQAFIQIPADKRRNRVYTVYDCQSQNSGGTLDTGTAAKIRIFLGWPDINLAGGIQAHETILFVQLEPAGGFNPPFTGPRRSMVDPNHRFLLIFDPSVQFANDAFTMISVERDANVNGSIYQTSAWGYYWDRAVFDVPGGPRHPGSQ